MPVSLPPPSSPLCSQKRRDFCVSSIPSPWAPEQRCPSVEAWAAGGPVPQPPVLLVCSLAHPLLSPLWLLLPALALSRVCILGVEGGRSPLQQHWHLY